MKYEIERVALRNSEAAEMPALRPDNHQQPARRAAVNIQEGRQQLAPHARPASSESGVGLQSHPLQDKNNDTSPSPVSFQRRRGPLTPVLVAELLSLDEATITRWARIGYLPARPMGTGKKKYWRFFEDEVIAWLNCQANGAVGSCPSPAPQGRILTPVQAAELLGLDDKTVTRWARNDYLPARWMGRGKKKYWRFFEDELVQWLNGLTNRERAA